MSRLRADRLAMKPWIVRWSVGLIVACLLPHRTIHGNPSACPAYSSRLRRPGIFDIASEVQLPWLSDAEKDLIPRRRRGFARSGAIRDDLERRLARQHERRYVYVPDRRRMVGDKGFRGCFANGSRTYQLMRRESKLSPLSLLLARQFDGATCSIEIEVSMRADHDLCGHRRHARRYTGRPKVHPVPAPQPFVRV